MKLYLTLVCSQLMYCTLIWRQYLQKDIQNTEKIQYRATKFILNNYDSNYKTRLLTLKFLPQMYLFEPQDVIFTVKSLKYSTKGFKILHHISFSTSNTRSSSTKCISLIMTGLYLYSYNMMDKSSTIVFVQS